MRGSTPLDVAAASVMDNNELALALEEPDLDKVSDHSNLLIQQCTCSRREKGKSDHSNFEYDLLRNICSRNVLS